MKQQYKVTLSLIVKSSPELDASSRKGAIGAATVTVNSKKVKIEPSLYIPCYPYSPVKHDSNQVCDGYTTLISEMLLHCL